MDPQAQVYGIDIETDTATDGLDPQIGRILAVAVAGPGGEAVFTDHDEAHLLHQVDRLLAVLPPGVLVTWNGAAFDLPYLATRSRLHHLDVGLRLQLDARLGLRGEPLPGHLGAYRGGWHDHRHLDAYRLYRHDVGRALRFSCALKSIAGLAGLEPIDHDASRVHELSPAQLRAYVASDARCARELAVRRWATASAAIDRLADDRPTASTVAPAPPSTGTPSTTRPTRILTTTGALP